jgi:hypothetical protein
MDELQVSTGVNIAIWEVGHGPRLAVRPTQVVNAERSTRASFEAVVFQDHGQKEAPGGRFTVTPSSDWMERCALVGAIVGELSIRAATGSTFCT